MSKFLGPIHNWLYSKIGRQEDLTRQLAEAAVKDGRLTDVNSYVRDVPALETVIDRLLAVEHPEETTVGELLG